jgi:preprotein translocase subunit SecA
VLRGHHFALVDEADSILIDEARTPLIIGLTQPNTAATVNLLRWSQRATQRLEANADFVYEPDRRSAYLTDNGCRKVLLMAKPSLLDRVDSERMFKHVEQAIISRLGFQRDRDYVVVDNKIVIVDESTGRQMEGRKWQDGLHQAVEAKEMVPITAATGQAARITMQSFFRQYHFLAGMTGTAVQGRRELRATYGINVTEIPTNRPCIRQALPPRLFARIDAKRRAVAEEVARLHSEGRAVLVGTPSVEASEALGRLLSQLEIKHEILNARYHELEAEIVAKAGRRGAVTIATNMAGRGTDIILDDTVREKGGLHVIATEMHSSARIDRQLVGRAARQGDPGSYQFFLSLEDELLRCLKPEKRQRLAATAAACPDGLLPPSWLSRFRRTQRFLERLHRKQRKDLLRHERHRTDAHHKMGLDPFLELTE